MPTEGRYLRVYEDIPAADMQDWLTNGAEPGRDPPQKLQRADGKYGW